MARPRRDGKTGLQGKPQQALKEWQQLSTAHKQFVDRFERNRRAYEAVMDKRENSQSWSLDLAPPYAEHIIETTIASMLDEQLRFRITPAPRLYQDEAQLRSAAMGAKAMEILLRYQMKVDRFESKQREIVLQERLAGLSPVKVYWHNKGKMRKGLEFPTDFDGVPMQPYETERPETIYDGPCTELCDVRDFYWDDDAASLQSCGVLCHVTWPTFEECKRQERLGYWRNVDQLPETRDFSSDLSQRERGDPDRKGNRIEVAEIWRREDDGKMRVYTIGNKSVLLAERDNPFWHGEFPFVAFVGQSKLFRIPGRPQVEKLDALQRALWTISNNRLDNLMFVNNAIHVINEDLIEDADSQEFYPGARWLAHGPAAEAYSMWAPNPVPAQVSIPAESMVKADMQNLAGGFPFTSTAEAQTVGASTATEASLVASLAQRSITGAKRHLYETYRQIGQMILELDRQFVREPVYALVVGADDEWEQKEIMPAIAQGEYLFDVEPMTESLMRQERRSEALSLFQAIMPAVPVLVSMGVLPNGKKFVENLLNAFDIQNTEGYFAQPPQQAPPGAPPGMGTPPAQGGPGVTNPSLAAGPLAVSNGNSLSPASMMTEMISGQGGPQNV